MRLGRAPLRRRGGRRPRGPGAARRGRRRRTRRRRTGVAQADRHFSGKGLGAPPMPFRLWGRVAPRLSAPVLGVLAAEGRIRRARPLGSWTSAQFRWAPADPLPHLPAGDAKTELARRYVATFGPVTVEDLKRWTGWNPTDTRRALAATGAEQVALDEGTGYLLPEDVDDRGSATDVEPAAALLPGLDPTAMGWRHRDWYLDPAHKKALFDCNGNIGPTVWWEGRIIGAWAQRRDGCLAWEPLAARPDRTARAAVEAEIARLTAFLGTTRVTPCYRTPLERRLAG
ncbi:DNA glycosylase AlkZ-like family protein [Streptomyces noursei]|uniref:DNA glycosylase AlkZ-like family protein n=1 Tax=Streptomyces noursei TaxID=1971 RepID=UPI003821D1B4